MVLIPAGPVKIGHAPNINTNDINTNNGAYFYGPPVYNFFFYHFEFLYI